MPPARSTWLHYDPWILRRRYLYPARAPSSSETYVPAADFAPARILNRLCASVTAPPFGDIVAVEKDPDGASPEYGAARASLR
jgi:hypothetical protein